ncbi:hypothetical protein RJ55_04057 [Drechmeria coniospora]|nr:hypothetical protein RJ55_04057 [Drechmeria coniospora]
MGPRLRMRGMLAMGASLDLPSDLGLAGLAAGERGEWERRHGVTNNTSRGRPAGLLWPGERADRSADAIDDTATVKLANGGTTK